MAHILYDLLFMHIIFTNSPPIVLYTRKLVYQI